MTLAGSAAVIASLPLATPKGVAPASPEGADGHRLFAVKIAIE
jgi:hypothetical protein